MGARVIPAAPGLALSLVILDARRYCELSLHVFSLSSRPPHHRVVRLSRYGSMRLPSSARHICALASSTSKFAHVTHAIMDLFRLLQICPWRRDPRQVGRRADSKLKLSAKEAREIHLGFEHIGPSARTFPCLHPHSTVSHLSNT